MITITLTKAQAESFMLAHYATYIAEQSLEDALSEEQIEDLVDINDMIAKQINLLG